MTTGRNLCSLLSGLSVLPERYLGMRLGDGLELVERRTTAWRSARAMAEVVGSANDRIRMACTIHWMSTSAMGSCKARPPVHFGVKK